MRRICASVGTVPSIVLVARSRSGGFVVRETAARNCSLGQSIRCSAGEVDRIALRAPLRRPARILPVDGGESSPRLCRSVAGRRCSPLAPRRATARWPGAGETARREAMRRASLGSAAANSRQATAEYRSGEGAGFGADEHLSTVSQRGVVCLVARGAQGWRTSLHQSLGFRQRPNRSDATH